MATSDGTLRLMELRDGIDERFGGILQNNPGVEDIEHASHLAICAGRLDTIIRRQFASDRRRKGYPER